MIEALAIESAPAPFAPRADEIVVVRRQLEVDDATLARYRALLDEREHVKVARFVFDRDRRSAAVSRGALRELLAPLTNEVVFVEGPQGKPALANGALDFNVSHSSAWLYIALTRGRAIGVDVEGGERDLDVDELASTVFTRAELAELVAASDRRAAFLRGWTRKEAYLKARGGGLFLPLQDFSVSLTPSPHVTLTSDREPHVAAQYQLLDLPAPPEHAAALAWRRSGVDVARVVLAGWV